MAKKVDRQAAVSNGSTSIGSYVASKKEGVTYDALRSSCSSTDRAAFDRSVVKALRNGEIDIRGELFVSRKAK